MRGRERGEKLRLREKDKTKTQRRVGERRTMNDREKGEKGARRKKRVKERIKAAIAQWICLHPQSCGPRFKFHAYHLLFFNL